MPKHFIKPYVNGIKMTSCLAKVITNEVFALFKAWKAAHSTILIPANTKLKLMIFKAGIPNPYIWSFALNIANNCLGNN